MSIFWSWIVSIPLFLILAILIIFIFSRQKKTINIIVGCLAFYTVLAVFAFDSLHYLSTSSEKTDGINLLPDVWVAMLNGFFSIVNTFTTPPSVSDSLIVIEETRYLDNCILLQILFWLSQVTGRLATYIFIVYLFGKKFLDILRIWIFKNIPVFPNTKKELYIIVGGDKNALMLGESIYDNALSAATDTPPIDDSSDDERKEKKSKPIILFLIDGKSDEKKIYEKAAKFNGIVRVVEDEQKFKDCLESVGLSKNSLKGKKHFKVVLMPDDYNAAKKVKVILDLAEEDTKTEEPIVEKDDANNKTVKLNIYAIVSNYKMKTDVDKVVANKRNKKNCIVHIIDEVEFVMHEMIRRHPPLECPGLVNIEVKDSKISVTANRNFTILILGFGKIGRRALAHLIINGQFVDKKGKGVKPRAIIIDKDAKRHFDCFKTDVPDYSLCCDIDKEGKDGKEEDVINNTIPGKCLDAIFTEHEKIDYIVIALDSDIHNHGAAEYINNYYRNKCNKEDPDCIVPFIAIYEKNGVPHDAKDKNNDNEHDMKTFTFGCRDEIFTDAIIIREKHDEKAKAMMTSIEGGKKAVNGKTVEWENLDLFTQERYRATATFSTSLKELAERKLKKGEIHNNKSAAGEIPENLTANEEAEKDAKDSRIKTDRLRDNAYYIMHGYTSLSVKQMNDRFEENKHRIIQEGKSIKENDKGLLEVDGVTENKLLDYARKDEEGKRHIRLAALDNDGTFKDIDESYKILVEKVYETAQGFNHFSKIIVNEFWKVSPKLEADKSK